MNNNNRKISRESYLINWAQSINLNKPVEELESLYNLYYGVKNPIKLVFGEKYKILSIHKHYLEGRFSKFSYRFDVVDKL